MTFGELLGIVWVSMTFGERLLHWAGSERGGPGDGSSGAGHPESGVSRAAPAAVASAFLRIACPSNSLLALIFIYLYSPYSGLLVLISRY